jgi:hypothetical protein
MKSMAKNVMVSSSSWIELANGENLQRIWKHGMKSGHNQVIDMQHLY